MAKTKNQNSILFLTTLGVYLGLVLAGAAPQAIASGAAMSRNFDIRDEIEFKDDVDDDPDEFAEWARAALAAAQRAALKKRPKRKKKAKKAVKKSAKKKGAKKTKTSS